MTVDDPVAWLRAHAGIEVVGCYAFGTTPAQADELLAFVTRGTKRATAESLTVQQDIDDEPFPEAGQRWGLLDGQGAPRYVVETVEVTTGPLGTVTPAFAWDEGEDDRTLESWLAGHRPYFAALGVDDPDTMPTMFERFRVVWPDPDPVVWLAPGVREARFDEHAAVRALHLARHDTSEVDAGAGERRDVGALPALVAVAAVVDAGGGEVVGALTFRPRPGGETTLVTCQTAPTGRADTPDVEVALRKGLDELGRRNGWTRVLTP